MKKFVILAVTFLMIHSVQAQSKSAKSSSYQTALGVKLLDGGGLSIKHFVFYFYLYLYILYQFASQKSSLILF